MSVVVGIDLGTTFSAAAALGPGGQPEVLSNRDGERLTPSVVLFETPEQILVGKLAKHSVAMQPEDSVQFVKRRMGEAAPVYVDERGKEYRAEHICSLILRRIAEDASAAIGEQVRDVVITVPAYFDDARRTATRNAGELAGLNVLRLINEPTAAALAYGIKSGSSGTYFVYDLGGGTFDVTIMRADGGSDFEVLATDGDRNLGGFDFDNKLIAHVQSRLLEQGGPDIDDDPQLSADLRERCEAAKIRLSNVDQAPIHFGAGGKTFRLAVTRAEFETMSSELLYRTELLMEAVLEQAGVTWSDIDKVLLVGGSTRMPMVRELVQRLSGKTPEPGVNPDEAVALGAAILAAQTASERGGGSGRELAQPVSISDVTSQALGELLLDVDTGRVVNVVIIPRNTPIPCKRESISFTVYESQRKVDLKVTEGEDEDPQYVAILHKTMMTLPPGLPKESPIRTVMSYDLDGVVHVELFDVANDRSLGEVELDRPNNLSASELEDSKEALRTLGLQ